jgi:hypothetical protein
MSNLRLGAIAIAAVSPFFLTGSASASSITETFNIDGTITATLDTITWESNGAIADEATIESAGLSGGFVGLGNTDVTIADLANPPEVVDSTGFTPTSFVTFLGSGLPSGYTLLIDFINAGSFPSAGCTATPAVPGQTCTPAITGGSPFDFTNLGNPGGPVTGSAAAFAFGGTTSDGGTWTANFTSQFNTPFQTVLAGLGSPGFSVTNSYSGTFTVTAAAVPEPNTLLFVFGGVCLLLASSRRKRSKTSAASD